MDTPCLPESLQTLIIDDDRLVRDFTVHTLEFGTNRKVTTFDSGFKAWQHLQRQPQQADIIIADANIPDINGLELLERVKHAFPGTRFIVTSSNPANEQTAYRLGADAFLAKPFDVKDLLTIIQELILTGEPIPERKSIPFNSKGSVVTGTTQPSAPVDDSTPHSL